MRRLTRRQFLQRAAELGVAAPAIAACGDSTAPQVAGSIPDLADPQLLAEFRFTDVQRRALSAAVARLVPAAGAGDWSAADAGAVEYIEQFLNAFSSGGNPRFYGGGPTRAQFGEFQPMSRAKRVAWQREVLRTRELYVAGLDWLNAQSPPANDFSALPAAAQDALLTSLDYQASPFFGALFDHTMEACYGPPVYGGNKDYVGWDSLCYEGDVHGVRFPGGEDATADHEPWRKFGGYAPEEMIAPGSCAGTKRRRT